MTVIIKNGSCCCGCEYCNSTPSSVDLTIVGVATGEGYSCNSCDSDFNQTFSLSGTVDPCAFFLSFADAGITGCYGGAAIAGLYAEIVEKVYGSGGWDVALIDSDGVNIAVWSWVGPYINNLDAYPNGCLTTGLTSVGAINFSFDEKEGAVCDWLLADITLDPVP